MLIILVIHFNSHTFFKRNSNFSHHTLQHLKRDRISLRGRGIHVHSEKSWGGGSFFQGAGVRGVKFRSSITAHLHRSTTILYFNRLTDLQHHLAISVLLDLNFSAKISFSKLILNLFGIFPNSQMSHYFIISLVKDLDKQNV